MRAAAWPDAHASTRFRKDRLNRDDFARRAEKQCHGRVAQARPWQKRGSGGGEGASWEGEESAPRPRGSNVGAMRGAGVGRRFRRAYVVSPVVRSCRSATRIDHQGWWSWGRLGTASSMVPAGRLGCRRMATPVANNALLQGWVDGEG